jgi:hypothetical protein
MDDTAKASRLAIDKLDAERQKEHISLKHAGNACYAGQQEATGTWTEAAFHFLTQVSTFPNLITPFIFASIGWGPGLAVFTVVTGTVIYCSYLMAEINIIDDIRFNRYRDLAAYVWGDKIGRPLLGVLNVLLVLGVMIGSILSGGQLLKALVLLYAPDTSLTLSEFIIMVGAAVLLLSLIPTLHDVRWLNAFGTLLVFVYCVITGALCIDAGRKNQGSKDYSVIWGTDANHVFQILNSVVLFGSIAVEPMIPEVQACLARPQRDMKIGMTASWPIVLFSILFVGIPGYWAFGNTSLTFILQNLTEHRGVVAAALAMAVVNIVIMINVFGNLLYEFMENYTADSTKGVLHPRNLVPRVICRGAAVSFFTFISCLIPFFASIQGLVSAVTYIPMDVVIPLLLYQQVKKPQGIIKWVHYGLAAIYTLFCIGGAISSLRGIIVLANTFKVFANI